MSWEGRTSVTAGSSPSNDLVASIIAVLGRTPDDASLQALLKSLGNWPLPELGIEETRLFVSDKQRGFSIVFDTASSMPNQLGAGHAPDTLVLVGCFFYSEGEEDFRGYADPLPHDVTWSDTSQTLVKKFGAPQNEIVNKKTGNLNSQRWRFGSHLLTATYRGGGASIKRFYLGMY